MALALVGTAVVGGAWYVSNKFADQLALKQAQNQARIWHKQAVSFLTLGNEAFEKQRVMPADVAMFRRIVTSSDVYRVTFFTGEGRAFWSTNFGVTGNQLDVKVLFPMVSAGRAYVKFANVPARDIDNIRLREEFGTLDPDRIHKIAEVYSPVIVGGKLIGAVGLRLDVSDLSNWFSDNMKRAGVVLSLAFGVLFLTAMLAAYRYARERAANVQELTEARDDAIENRSQLEHVNTQVSSLNRELEANVRQLREAQDEIIRKGKMAQLGQLTATVAHDLRNPLGAVRTAAFLIERKTRNAGLDIDKPLERIANGVARCDDIITELLDFTRSKELQLTNVNLDDWVTEIVQEQASRLPEMVELQCHLGLDGRTVRIDQGKMQRALINLLTNASEAMVGKGNNPDDIVTENPRIIVATQATADGIAIRVIDNGPGISEENLSKIRDPLFTTKSFGVGLGLPAVEKILEQHGGGLKISTGDGNGTQMTAWFPDTGEIQEAA